MSQLSVLLQDTARSERETEEEEEEEEVRTIIGLLREHIMDDFQRGTTTTNRTTSSFKERLIGFKACFGCCGATWGFRSIRDDDDEQQQQITETASAAAPSPPPGLRVDPPAASSSTNSNSGMNLAAALAADRQFREANYEEGEAGVNAAESGGGGGGTLVRISLMRLLEEAEAGGDHHEIIREKLGVRRITEEECNDRVCCVCMVRRKGAALIPCGHTYCRVCSREVWVNRGSCPLCNRSILEILDIF